MGIASFFGAGIRNESAFCSSEVEFTFEFFLKRVSWSIPAPDLFMPVNHGSTRSPYLRESDVARIKGII